MACETAEKLMALAKSEDIELTKEEAGAYMAEMADVELDEAALKQVAGGTCYMTTCDDHSDPARAPTPINF